MRRISAILLATLLIVGCGSQQIVQPETRPELANSIVIDLPFESVWSRAIPQIGKSFFVINTIDKSSGILNISYSGDPEEFVDCGRLHQTCGFTESEFSAAKAQQQYTLSAGIRCVSVLRTMALEGKTNLVFQKESASSTRLTVSTLYILTKTITVVQAPAANSQEIINFHTGGEASFPGAGTTCHPNGKFENDILQLIK